MVIIYGLSKVKMTSLQLPASTIEKMVCMQCKDYLSLFPVYIKSDATGAVCGRCKVTEEDKFFHDRAYESIAQFLLFPCRYKSNGCKEQLTPPRLAEHETSCAYRKYDCPSKAYTKCQWQGLRSELIQHFETTHTGLLLKNSRFELNFINTYKENALLPFGEELFIVRKEVDSCNESFACTIQHLKSSDSTECYEYFLKLVSGDKACSCKLKKKSTTSGDNVTKFNGEFVKEKLHDPVSVIVDINIIKEDTEDEEVPAPVKDVKKNPDVNWDILAELECPVCLDFMLPPIYQCINGHSICSSCKRNVAVCPLCKNAIQDTKNFVLEKMTTFLIYPCKYYKNGCPFASKLTEIKNHEENCELGPYECPMKDIENCKLLLKITEIVTHVDNNHEESILKTDKINVPFNKNEQSEKQYVIKFSGKIFKLFYKYANEKFYWAVQPVGPASDCKKFKFEIDVIDNSGNKLRCYLRGLCVPVNQNVTSFNDPRKYIMMTIEQVEPLITAMLSYRVRIVKD